MEGRTPASCAICYAQAGVGVAARVKVRGMMLCEHHAPQIREAQPITPHPDLPNAQA